MRHGRRIVIDGPIRGWTDPPIGVSCQEMTKTVTIWWMIDWTLAAGARTV
jgi:hypothetical protein